MATGVLFAYDGTEGARRAIEVGARLFPDAFAVVAHVADRPAVAASVAAPGVPLPIPDPREESPELERAARAIADEGADLAHRCGLRAAAAVGWGSGAGGVAQRLFALAEEHHATVIVLGARRRGGLVAALLGSVCDDVVHRAGVPVLVVPHDDED